MIPLLLILFHSHADYVVTDDLLIYEPTYTNMTLNTTSAIPPALPVLLKDLSAHITSCHIDGFNTQFKVITGIESLYCNNVHLFTQDLYTGEDKLVTVGIRKENNALNLIKGITVCMWLMMNLNISLFL